MLVRADGLFPQDEPMPPPLGYRTDADGSPVDALPELEAEIEQLTGRTGSYLFGREELWSLLHLWCSLSILVSL